MQINERCFLARVLCRNFLHFFGARSLNGWDESGNGNENEMETSGESQKHQ